MDLEKIEDLIEILKDTDVSELNIEEEGKTINIKRGFGNKVKKENIILESDKYQTPEISEVKEGKKSKDNKENSDREEIVAPMVGTFYRAPSPDAEPFVKVGDTVSNGDVVCIIEAMKLMNEIESERDCKIVDILVEDGEAIEYGQALFVIEEI